MREPEDEVKRQRRKLLQSIGIWAATIVALGGVMFTLGFFVGRATGGTQLEVYVQNPEGVYLRAETTAPVSGAGTALSGQLKMAAVTTTAAPVTTAATTTVTQTSMTTTPVPTTTSTETPTESTQATTAYIAGKVNINTATEAQLDTLPGIGPVKAKSIIAYREASGAFASIEDLIRVDGIGEKTMADLRPLITVGD
ncbi:MAG: ComEA family DNA-binding protein [Clostridiaceae bacterium]|nr:ComEA family DNA-binding protein [Clostridiaceae bacterium]